MYVAAVPGLSRGTNRLGPVHYRDEFLSLDHRHGKVPLGDVLELHPDFVDRLGDYIETDGCPGSTCSSVTVVVGRGEGWALWTAFLAPVVAVVIALPLHYPYHFATLGHLGLIYLDAVILLVGTVLSYRAMKA